MALLDEPLDAALEVGAGDLVVAVDELRVGVGLVDAFAGARFVVFVGWVAVGAPGFAGGM